MLLLRYLLIHHLMKTVKRSLTWENKWSRECYIFYKWELYAFWRWLINKLLAWRCDVRTFWAWTFARRPETLEGQPVHQTWTSDGLFRKCLQFVTSQDENRLQNKTAWPREQPIMATVWLLTQTEKSWEDYSAACRRDRPLLRHSGDEMLGTVQESNPV